MQYLTNCGSYLDHYSKTDSGSRLTYCFDLEGYVFGQVGLSSF